MKYTFKKFQAEYPDDAACLASIMQAQFGGTKITCPACGVVDAQFHAMTKRRAYACQECGHHIYPCAGTIFEKSRTKLTLWFFAMYLMTSTRHGVAAKELQRQLGVTYKCAWRMAHELRKLMAAADIQGPLGGHVEIDETYVGGEPRKRYGKNRTPKKTIVMGLVERDGVIRAGVVPNVKRAIRGVHVHVSSKHLWKYVSEFSYRRNFRHSHERMFNRLVGAFSLPRLVEP